MLNHSNDIRSVFTGARHALDSNRLLQTFDVLILIFDDTSTI